MAVASLLSVHLPLACGETHAELTVFTHFTGRPVAGGRKRSGRFLETAVAACLINLFVDFIQDVMLNGPLMPFEASRGCLSVLSSLEKKTTINHTIRPRRKCRFDINHSSFTDTEH